MAKRGRSAKIKGKVFEQRVARDLRKIFDPPMLQSQIEKATPSERFELLKRSLIRRGDQSRGAIHPDVEIISPIRWWLELQHADVISPRKKLEQAMRDVESMRNVESMQKNNWMIAAICKRTSERMPTVALVIPTLLYLYGIVADVGKDVSSYSDDIVIISYEDFLKYLELQFFFDTKDKLRI